MDDEVVVEAQLGREPRGAVEVVARCHLSLPAVIRVPPVLDDGTPFPTLYWLTCPLAGRLVSGLEASGGVRAFQARRNGDPAFGRACDEADLAYAEERARAIAEPTPGRAPVGGVAGTRGGVKCLHAHLAHHMAGRVNPIGAEVSAEVGPPRCSRPCVSPGGDGRPTVAVFRERRPGPIDGAPAGT